MTYACEICRISSLNGQLSLDKLKVNQIITICLIQYCELSLCRVKLVKLLAVHRYSVDIFSYSGPSGIFGSDGKQNTA